jgi:hypothetical protein
VWAHIIESGVGRRAICPSWYPARATPPWDERDGIDKALIEQLVPAIRQKRAALLDELDRGAALLPHDDWITGQRVRFRMDQADTAGALRAAGECTASAWWCAALAGYMLSLHELMSHADSAFAHMLALMPAQTRCNWTDLSLLLPEEDRDTYREIPCEARDSLNARFWWLADVLHSDSVNERRATHFARKVLVELRSATSFHERWDMRPEAGGNAVAEMLLRYGWPSFAWWGGRSNDFGHFGYLGTSDSVTIDHGRFTTVEYTYPRFRLVPALRAIQNPAHSHDTDWAISARAHAAIYPADTLWWPTEHYERVEGPLIQLWSQHGMFRRAENVLFAMASRFLEEEFAGAQGDTLWGWLFSGHGPSTMRREPKGAIVGLTNVFKAFVPAEPQLISLELHGRRPAGVVARTRFGIEPPPPLSALPAGEISISSPVFIRPTTPDQLPPNDPELALSRMYGTAIFRSPQAIGIYWETYGVMERDSVELTIRIESHAPRPGFLRRIGIALGIAQAPAGTVTVEWSESQPQSHMRIVSGPTPIQGRVMSLGISQLRPGEYSFVVSAARPGKPEVTARRSFWIVQ